MDAAWDDAIHIAAPWEPRSSLCGQWNRNLAKLAGERPDGMSGCWTCLMAADWLGEHARLPVRKETKTAWRRQLEEQMEFVKATADKLRLRAHV